MALLGAVSCCKKTQPGEPALYSAADFDSTIDGKAVSLYTLKNANGMAAQITNYGGIIVDVWVPAKDGAFKDVVLGYPKLADYFVPENTFAGAITGRYANRIANGKFTLDGKEYSLAINNGPNTLHGGIVGFSKKVWDARTFTNDAGEQALELIYVSPDGEENFPGTLTTKVVYTVTVDNQLRIDYTATTDAPTVLNLTNHAYFNLHGGDHKTSVNSHRVTINADRYTPTDSTLIPTGEIASLDGSALDFRTPTTIGERVLGPDSAFNYRDGYDHNYVIRRSSPDVVEAAEVYEPSTGIVMTVLTDTPGIQFFTDFMRYLHCPCVTGEKEYLLFLPQFHEETKRLPLPFFIEPYKNIIQHYRQRFNLLAKSQRHSQPDGQIYLISRTGRPEFCAFSVVCYIYKLYIPAIVTDG